MEEGQQQNKALNNLPGWIKNPLVLTGMVIVLVVVLYFLLPWFRSMDSPFTQYKPLPIDSTYIKLDTTSESKPEDTLKNTVEMPNQPLKDSQKSPADSSSISDLFKLNTDYDELDPNEQVNRVKDEKADDLFYRLVLADLESAVLDELKNTHLELGIQPILHMLSTTAVEMLSDVNTRYQLEILQAIELSPSVQGVIISDGSEEVVYATNRKFMNQYLFELFPRYGLTSEKLTIREVENLEFISMPVHHRYGKIGTIVLILQNQ